MKNDPLVCCVGLRSACGFFKCANQRGAKSAKSPLDTLLALLALPHIGSRRALGIFEGVKHILVGPWFRWCQESVPSQLLSHIRPPPTWFLEVRHEEGVHLLAVGFPV